MHPITLILDLACGHQVGADGVLLWQICSEVHLFPFEHLLDFICARKAELAQMPAPDEVDLAVGGLLVDAVRVAEVRDGDVLVSLGVRKIMSYEKCIFLTV